MQVGTGAFTGCSGLKELVIHQKKGIKSCAKEILGELWQKIDVDFLYEMVRQVENVRIWFSGAL